MSRKKKGNFLERLSAKFYSGYYIRYVRFFIFFALLINFIYYFCKIISSNNPFSAVYGALYGMAGLLALFSLITSLNAIVFTRKIIKFGKCYEGKIVSRKKKQCRIEYKKGRNTETVVLPMFRVKWENCKVYVFRDCCGVYNYYAGLV